MASDDDDDDDGDDDDDNSNNNQYRLSLVDEKRWRLIVKLSRGVARGDDNRQYHTL